ncbi:carnitine O-acetyltransferase-like isoform X1 [Cloeon dipterum]|uniref:carnitine O-acetyltransferase-like isoform X1 n=2 Tax=Cloeon dipterum TaxID=197152 RepID=UPI00321FA7BB
MFAQIFEVSAATASKVMAAHMSRNFLLKLPSKVCSTMAPNIISARFSTSSPKASALPRLPVPPLKITLDRYLRSIRPFVNAEELKVTENLAAKFGSAGGVGEKLQKLLDERAKNTENWLADWWLNTAYLEFRAPVVVFSNPGLVFPRKEISSVKEQLSNASLVIAAALDFKVKLDSNEIAQEKMGPHPLDMSQYFKVLGTCRIPAEKRDKLRLPNEKDPAKHIVVVHNNQFFKVNVYGNHGGPLSQGQILGQLKDCIHDSQEVAPPVGILTSEHRDNWAKAHKILSQSAQNKAVLDAIETCLFLVCIDGPPSPDERAAPNQFTSAALKMTHGGGSQGNSANRWFDKTIQFVFGPDGEVGLTYEHSPAEGQPIAVMMDHIVNYCAHRHPQQPALRYAKPQILNFEVANEVSGMIEQAKINLDKLVDDLEMYSFAFTGYGKEYIKSQKLSPDSYVQMGIQYAFFRLHNVPGAHYESAATRRFIHGRTETIRSCSSESVKFAQTMLNGAASANEKAATLRNAIKAHKDYATLALAGEGVDRHLLGLRLIAAENGIELPDLFKDVAFTRSTHMRLSTSQVAGRAESHMCYGPLVTDGYACCYNPRSNDMIFGTSAHNSCPETSARKFAAALEESFTDMQRVLNLSPLAKL